MVIVMSSEALRPVELVTVNVRTTISLQVQAEGAVKVVVGECAFARYPIPRLIDHVYVTGRPFGSYPLPAS
jgi:hypothetical protein